jgi:hypothetical protein
MYPNGSTINLGKFKKNTLGLFIHDLTIPHLLNHKRCSKYRQQSPILKQPLTSKKEFQIPFTKHLTSLHLKSLSIILVRVFTASHTESLPMRARKLKYQ